MDRYNRAAGYIQGFLRMRILRFYFLTQRLAAQKIQVTFYCNNLKKSLRKFFVKNRQINRINAPYQQIYHNYLGHVSHLEHDLVFKGPQVFDEIKNLENFTRVKFFEGENNFKEKVKDVPTYLPGKLNCNLTKFR